MQSDINTTDLKNTKLITLKENSELLKDLDLNIATTKELEKELEQGSIAILSIEQLNPKYKVLNIDGQNPFSSNFNKDSYVFNVKYSFKEGDFIFPEYNQSNITSIFAGGEIIPSRAVDRLSLNKNNNYTYLFDFLKEDISNSDIAVALLESPLTGDPVPCTGCLQFKADDRVAEGLKTVGFDVIGTASNHAGDSGQFGYSNTIDNLIKAGLKITGSGNSDNATLIPAIIDLNGYKIGFLSSDEVATYYWNRNSNNLYGTNGFTKLNPQKSPDTNRIEQIKAIKTENNIDYLVVLESWGIEYNNKPANYQVDLAHALIDAGVDLIIGTHPHWVQSIEFYKDKPIFYSLGNFIFDQTHSLETRQSIATKLIYYNNELKSIELIPLQVCGYHQTNNNVTDLYLNNNLSIDEIYNQSEKEACVYWQPKKLKPNHPSYKQILERVFEYTDLNNN